MAARRPIDDILADYAWANDAKDENILKRIFAEDSGFSLVVAGVQEPIGQVDGAMRL